jgi:purine-binding chemotaxis protein CheW
MSYVVVRLGGSRFAIQMDAVSEVGRLPGFTRVPGTPSWCAGVANWRGRILGVLDLRPLLDLPGEDSGRGREARLVVLQNGVAQVGVLADRVDGVLEVEDDDLEPPMATLSAEAASLLRGQASDAEGPVGVLDELAVFALRERVASVRRAG